VLGIPINCNLLPSDGIKFEKPKTCPKYQIQPIYYSGKITHQNPWENRLFHNLVLHTILLLMVYNTEQLRINQMLVLYYYIGVHTINIQI